MKTHLLKVGDLIVRAKGIFSTHYIVYLGFINGTEMAAENQIGHGVRVVPLNIALNGNSIKRVEKFTGNELQRKEVILKVKNLIGATYNLVKFNCEHFGRSISHGKFESKQVLTACGIAAIGGLGLVALGKNQLLKGIGFLLIVMAIIIAITQVQSSKPVRA